MLLKIKVCDGYIYLQPSEVVRVDCLNMKEGGSGRINIFLKSGDGVVSMFDDAHETFENIKDFLTNYIEDSDKHQLIKDQ